MPSPDEFIEGFFLQHADTQYDALKRHEYYLRTRNLKGRHPGLVDAGAVLNKVKNINSSTIKKHKTAAQQRHETTAHLLVLKNRLERLQKVLALLVKQAKGRSGVDSPTKKTAKTDRKPSKLTAEQRSKAAKRSKAYRRTHKPNPSQQVKELDARIKVIQAKIRKLRAELDTPKQQVHKKNGLRPELSNFTSNK
jgi:hypothetical protein